MDVNNWINRSLMAERGESKGRVGTTHELTEEKQENFHFTIGPYTDPVMTVSPGDRIAVETRDAFSGLIKTEQDKPSEKIRMPFANPQNGPIMVGGAEPGDALMVLGYGNRAIFQFCRCGPAGLLRIAAIA